MKNKIGWFLAVILALTAFFFVTNPGHFVSADDLDQAIEAGKQGAKEVEQQYGDDGSRVKAIGEHGANVVPGQKSDSDPMFDANEIKSHLDKKDMDWVNQNIIVNYKMYHVGAQWNEPSRAISHVLDDLFISVNINIIYAMTDKALALLFDLPKITSSMNNVLTQVQKFNKNIWYLKAFQGLVIVLFAFGVTYAFVKSSKDLKSILIVLLMAVLGTGWISSGGQVLTTINNMTSTTQSAVFTATSGTDQSNITGTSDDFKNSMRYKFYTESVERPFALGNYGVASISQVKERDGDPYRLLGGKVTDQVLNGKEYGNNDFVTKNSSKNWYQTTIAFVSPFVSLAYAVPYLAIGIVNMFLQLAAIVLYYVAPFTVMLSFIPKYASSAIRTAMQALAVLMGKVVLLFGILFVGWTGQIVDIIVPPTDSASVILNALLYITLMIALWKNKGHLANAIAGNSVVGNMADKMSMTRGGHALSGAVKEGFDTVKGGTNYLKQRRQDKSDKDKESNRKAQEEADKEEQMERNSRLDSMLDDYEADKEAKDRQSNRKKHLDKDGDQGQPDYQERGNDRSKRSSQKDFGTGDVGDEEPVKYNRRSYLKGDRQFDNGNSYSKSRKDNSGQDSLRDRLNRQEDLNRTHRDIDLDEELR